MTVEKFLETLEDIMETEEKLKLETKLEDVPEWDSVSMVSFFRSAASTFQLQKYCPNKLKPQKPYKIYLLLSRENNAFNFGNARRIVIA